MAKRRARQPSRESVCGRSYTVRIPGHDRDHEGTTARVDDADVVAGGAEPTRLVSNCSAAHLRGKLAAFGPVREQVQEVPRLGWRDLATELRYERAAALAPRWSTRKSCARSAAVVYFPGPKLGCELTSFGIDSRSIGAGRGTEIDLRPSLSTR